MEQRSAGKQGHQQDVGENKQPEPSDVDKGQEGIEAVSGRRDPGAEVDRPQPPRLFLGIAFSAEAKVGKQRHRPGAPQRNTSGTPPSRMCPTASKCAPRDWICCDRVCMSRKRRSNGLPGKIASTPAAL